MPDPKLIHKERLKVEDEEKARISYNDIFTVKDDEDVDYAEVLERNNQEWARKLNQARQESVREGYEAGVKDGKEKAKEVIEEQLHHFERALVDLDQRMQQTVNDLKPGVTSLVFDLAEKVLQVPLESKKLRSWTEQQVADALASFTQQPDVTITVSEQDFDAIHTLLEKLNYGGHVHVKYKQDMNPGEYRIETPREAIVNSFRKKLQHLRANVHVKDWGTESDSENDENSGKR